MVKGAIFDLDDILTATEEFSYRSWKIALEEHDIPFPVDDYWKYAGKTSDDILNALDSKLTEAVKEDLKQRKRNLLAYLLESEELEAMPYARETLEFFRACGIPICVASGSTRKNVGYKLGKTGLLHLVDKFASGGDVQQSKPAPDIYLFAAKLLGLTPEDCKECLAFEDTETGVISAKEAGLVCIAVPTQLTQGQDFSRADKIFPDLNKAMSYVKEKYKLP